MNNGILAGVGRGPLEVGRLAVGDPWGEHHQGAFGGTGLNDDNVQEINTLRPQPFGLFSVWQRERISSADFDAPVATIGDQRTFGGGAPAFNESAALRIVSAPRFDRGEAPTGGITGLHLEGAPTVDSSVTVPRSAAISSHWNAENGTYTVAGGFFAHVGSVVGTQTETRVFEAETANLFATMSNQQGFYYRNAGLVNDTGLSKTNWGFVIGGTTNTYGSRFASWHNGNVGLGGAGTRFVPLNLLDLRETVTLSAARTTTADGTTTSGQPTISAADAAFTVADIGRAVTGTNVGTNAYIISIQSATAATLSVNSTGNSSTVAFTVAAGASEGYASTVKATPTYDQAQTVTRHNYFEIDTPTLTNSAVVTDAPLFRFNAAIGTHKSLASNGSVATTITSLGPTGAATTIQGWLKINVNGTLRFIPMW